MVKRHCGRVLCEKETDRLLYFRLTVEDNITFIEVLIMSGSLDSPGFLGHVIPATCDLYFIITLDYFPKDAIGFPWKRL